MRALRGRYNHPPCLDKGTKTTGSQRDLAKLVRGRAEHWLRPSDAKPGNSRVRQPRQRLGDKVRQLREPGSPPKTHSGWPKTQGSVHPQLRKARHGKSWPEYKVRMCCLPLSEHWLCPLPVMVTWTTHAWASVSSSIRRLDKMLCEACPGSNVHRAWSDQFGSVVIRNKRHQVRSPATLTSITLPTDLSHSLTVQVESLFTCSNGRVNTLRWIPLGSRHPLEPDANDSFFGSMWCNSVFLSFALTNLCPVASQSSYMKLIFILLTAQRKRKPVKPLQKYFIIKSRPC